MVASSCDRCAARGHLRCVSDTYRREGWAVEMLPRRLGDDAGDGDGPIEHPGIEIRTLYLRTLRFRTIVPDLVQEFRWMRPNPWEQQILLPHSASVSQT